MDEHQVNAEPTNLQPPPAQEEPKSPEGCSGGIANCSDIEDAATEIIALADVVATIIGTAMDTCRNEGGDLEIDLNYDTLPTLIRMIGEKADDIKHLADQEADRQMAAKKNSLHCSHGEGTPDGPL